jgi:hypothetical protein
MTGHALRIVTEKDDLREGLFGEIFLHTFEILPYLYKKEIFPDWQIRAKFYGTVPGGLVIPGALDLAYEVAPGPKRNVNLVPFRERYRHALGNDWRALHKIWASYFRIPSRITASADTFGPIGNVLGVHFRGNDKQTAAWDTNPVSHEDYFLVIQDFLSTRPELTKIFLATDDFEFCEFLQSKLSHIEILNLGRVEFHKLDQTTEPLDEKMDRAVLDCVLLSRCGAVLQTSSALSSFAKILNPELEIYRVGASKPFGIVPYFPVAFVPIYTASAPNVAAVVQRLTTGDWSKAPNAVLFSSNFVARPHGPPILRLVYAKLRKIPGLEWIEKLPSLAAFIVRGFKRN